MRAALLPSSPADSVAGRATPIEARWPVWLAGSAVVGGLAAYAPRFALPAGVGALLVVARRLWLPATWTVLFGLVVWSYGFNNISLPVGDLQVPLVDAVLAFALVASFPWWRDLRHDRLGRRLLVLLSLLSLVAAGRLLFDFPRFGVLAGRDALFVFEAWAVFVGYGLARLQGPSLVERRLGLLWRVAVLWLLLFPFRFELAALGPTVGVQRPVPLLDFTSAGFVSVVAFFWFLRDRRPDAGVLAALSLVVVLMAQSRGAYLGLLGAGLFVLWRSRRSDVADARRLMGRLVAATLLVAVMMWAAPPLPGRLGEPVSVGTAAEQLGTLLGNPGPGEGSFRHRLKAWPEVVDLVSKADWGWLVGVGLGPDLFEGFAVAGGVLVRKPHNDVLEVWARLGLVGLLPWLALVVSLAVWALRVSMRGPNWWLVGLQSVVAVTALSQPFFGFAYGGMVYMLLMGMALGSSHSSARLEESVPPTTSA